VDFHIPVERVHESAEVMKALGGQVTERIYPGMGHTINMDEINYAKAIMQALLNIEKSRPRVNGACRVRSE
jgi:phospholipase/carboxylesterase